MLDSARTAHRFSRQSRHSEGRADAQFIEVKEQFTSSVMLTFFAINVMLDLHTATDLVMTMIGELQEIFPDSVHLKAQRAMVFYHMRGKLHPQRI